MENCFRYNEKRVKFKIVGEGLPVLLIHGFTESKEIWDDFAEDLQHKNTIITVDLPGHGQSELLQDNTMESWAQLVKALIDYLEVGPVVIIGHSMGGYLSCAFSEMYPEMVRGLGLFHSSARADAAEAKEGRVRTMDVIRNDKGGFLLKFIPDLFFHENRERLRDKIDLLLQRASLLENKTLLACQQAMHDRQGYIELLMDAVFPVLFIIGKQDSRVDFNHVFAQTLIPKRSYVLILEDCGHMGYLESPKETLAMLVGFIGACE